MKDPLPDYMKDIFGAFSFPDKPVPPRKDATIAELIQNMEHNIKVRDK